MAENQDEYAETSQGLADRLKALSADFTAFNRGDYDFLPEDSSNWQPYEILNEVTQEYLDYASRCVAYALDKARIANGQLEILHDIKRHLSEIATPINSDIKTAEDLISSVIDWYPTLKNSRDFHNLYPVEDNIEDSQAYMALTEDVADYQKAKTQFEGVAQLPNERNLQTLLEQLKENRLTYAQISYEQVGNRIDMAGIILNFRAYVAREGYTMPSVFPFNQGFDGSFIPDTLSFGERQLRITDEKVTNAMDTVGTPGYAESPVVTMPLDLKL